MKLLHAQKQAPGATCAGIAVYLEHLKPNSYVEIRFNIECIVTINVALLLFFFLRDFSILF